LSRFFFAAGGTRLALPQRKACFFFFGKKAGFFFPAFSFPLAFPQAGKKQGKIKNKGTKAKKEKKASRRLALPQGKQKAYLRHTHPCGGRRPNRRDIASFRSLYKRLSITPPQSVTPPPPERDRSPPPRPVPPSVTHR
jgi:hypothetical protein